MLKDISIIFMSIFFESLPFLLLGSIISSIIEVYVSNDFIRKIKFKSKILNSLLGVFMGFFLPACDCAVIPVSKRLLKKKVPLSTVISFTLSSPIINPVVLFSTFTAFRNVNMNIFYKRLIIGILISIVIGIIMEHIFKNKDVVIDSEDECDCLDTCEIDLGELTKYKKGKSKDKIKNALSHTVIDFFGVVKYLIVGALIASVFEVVIPRSVLIFFNSNIVISVIALMLFAYLLSLCSTSDSFVGKSLLSIFPEDAIVAYLVLGPMIDIKNTIVLLGCYNKKYTLILILLIFIFTFLFSIGASFIWKNI